MKKRSVLLLLLLSAIMTAYAQTQQGYVKTKGRLGSNGTIIQGTRLSGATVTVKGHNAVVSSNNGTFTLAIPGNSYYLQNVQKQGYVLTDPDVLSRQYAYSKNPLVLVLETPSQQTDDKLAAEKKIRRTLQRQLQEKEDEIESLKMQQKLSEEEYRKQMQGLYAQQESNEKLITEMADRYSRMDFDDVDEFNRRISHLILDGRLTEADSLLNTKGDINARAAVLRQHQEANAQAEQEIKKKQKKLEKSKEYVQKEMEDLAQDCYSKFELFKMQHKNDSAAYYIELRRSLDSTNITWISQVGDFYYEYMADYTKALMLFQLAASEAICQYGNDNEKLGIAYSSIGDVYQRLGKYKDAVEYYERALEIADSNDRNPSNLSTCLNNIGMIYMNQGDFYKSLEYLEKSLEIRLKLYGQTNNPDIATSYYHIGMVNMYLQSYTKALDYYQKSLDIRKKTFGEVHQDVANSIFSIGFLYFQQGKYEVALKMYEEARTIYHNIYGDTHPFLATCTNAIGGVCSRKKDYSRALDYYEKALSIRTAVYGNYHPDIATSLNNIGSIYDYQEDYKKALDYYKKALDMRKMFYKDNHPSIATSYINIGGVYYSEGDYQTAIDYYEKALEIYKETYGESHSRTTDMKSKISILKNKAELIKDK